MGLGILLHCYPGLRLRLHPGLNSAARVRGLFEPLVGARQEMLKGALPLSYRPARQMERVRFELTTCTSNRIRACLVRDDKIEETFFTELQRPSLLTRIGGDRTCDLRFTAGALTM